jgi:hypothetical protein
MMTEKNTVNISGCYNTELDPYLYISHNAEYPYMKQMLCCDLPQMILKSYVAIIEQCFWGKKKEQKCLNKTQKT